MTVERKGIWSKSIRSRRCWAKWTRAMVTKHFHSFDGASVYLKIHWFRQGLLTPAVQAAFDGGIKWMEEISVIEDVQINVMRQCDKYNKSQYNCGSWCFSRSSHWRGVTQKSWGLQPVRYQDIAIVPYQGSFLFYYLLQTTFKVTLQEVGWGRKAWIPSTCMLYL